MSSPAELFELADNFPLQDIEFFCSNGDDYGTFGFTTFDSNNEEVNIEVIPVQHPTTTEVFCVAVLDTAEQLILDSFLPARRALVTVPIRDELDVSVPLVTGETMQCFLFQPTRRLGSIIICTTPMIS